MLKNKIFTWKTLGEIFFVITWFREDFFMGSYLNPGSTAFQGSLRSQIYIDKSGLIGKDECTAWNRAEICLRQPTKTIRKIYGSKYAACIL